ncbi:MAG: DUF2497 domain-containing protein [Alphaproteobacteria bacterium]|nr:DUF2497 domain-containing protein [Alphaproteobacteria bacterium]
MSNAAPQTGEPTMEEILASIRRIISEEEGEAAPAAPEPEAAPPVAEAAPAPKAAAEDEDVLELTDIVEETAPASPPEPAPRPRPRPALVEPADDIAFDPEPETLGAFPASGLVADDVAERAGAVFDRLARDMAITDSAAGNSIEGVVRALLKPMLKQWLDDHLTDIVESIVREEVARVASRRR